MSLAGVVAVGSYWQWWAVGWWASDWTIVKGFYFIPSVTCLVSHTHTHTLT